MRESLAGILLVDAAGSAAIGSPSYDQPIPASQMIGRQVDVREVAAMLAGGASVVVAGPRRTGKTSVCDAALGRLAKQGFYTVPVDLFRIATAAELAEALVTKTISNRSPLRRAVHQTRRAGRLRCRRGAHLGGCEIQGATRRRSRRSRFPPALRHAIPIAISTMRLSCPVESPRPTTRR